MWPIGFYKVVGKSMEPSYHEGDYLLINRLAFYLRSPRKEEVVLLKDPRTERAVLKRIQDVKKQRYSVRGDNPDHSTDSRTFGWVRLENILGTVLFQIRA